MRIINVPDPDVIVCKDVPVQGGKTEVKVPFKEFLQTLFDTASDELSKGIKNIYRAGRIAKQIEGATTALSLEDADYDLLVKCAEKAVFHVVLARQLIPFFVAVETAQEVKV